MTFTHFVYCRSQVPTSGEGNQEWRAEEKAREYHLLPADQLLGGWGWGVAVACAAAGKTATPRLMDLRYSADIFPDLCFCRGQTDE